MNFDTSSSVTGQSCNYATLGNYNKDSRNKLNARPTAGVYVVPSFGGPSYDTLSHNNANSCNGYSDIKYAYGKKCDPSYFSSSPCK